MSKQERKVSEMPDDVFNACLKAAMNESENKLKLSKKEQESFLEAMKKPEFTKLMKEYMDEISDPKNRAEQEAYLKQLEQENKVPSHMKLVRPTAAFCIKVIRLESSGKNGSLLDTKAKLFINVCTTDEVEAAKPQRTDKGIHWSLPYSLGPLRHENDKKGVAQPTLDFAMHSETVAKCFKDGRFQKMVIDTAIDAVESRIAQVMSGNVKLERGSARVLKGVKCMGGSPATMQMKRLGNQEEDALQNDKPIQDAHKESAKPLIKEADLDTEKKPSNEPEYRIVHRGNIDLSDFLEHGYELAPRASKRPKELVLRIQVPKLKSAKHLDIETSENSFKLTCSDKSIADYQLHLDLPYPVDQENGSAKFDKVKRTLEVVLPVKPPPKDQVLIPVQRNEPLIQESESPESDESESLSQDIGHQEEYPTSQETHSRWVQREGEQEEEQVREQGTEAAEMEKLLAMAREAAKLPLPKAEDFEEVKDPAVEESEREKEEVKVEKEDGSETFIPSSVFTGSRANFVFKKGALGQGYYLDEPPTVVYSGQETEASRQPQQREQEELTRSDTLQGSSRLALRNKEIFELD